MNPISIANLNFKENVIIDVSLAYKPSSTSPDTQPLALHSHEMVAYALYFFLQMATLIELRASTACCAHLSSLLFLFGSIISMLPL